jgi:hypothetical protein
MHYARANCFADECTTRRWLPSPSRSRCSATEERMLFDDY